MKNSVTVGNHFGIGFFLVTEQRPIGGVADTDWRTGIAGWECVSVGRKNSPDMNKNN